MKLLKAVIGTAFLCVSRDYFFSKTMTLFTVWLRALTPLKVIVIAFPSFVIASVPSIVRASTRVSDCESASGAPTIGCWRPSRLYVA